MAKDFPDDKYDFKLKPEMRSFGSVIVHVASGNVYAAKAGRGEKVNWDELDPTDYKTKAQVVALMEKSITDAEATLKGLGDDSFAKTIEPWISVTEHTAEQVNPAIPCSPSVETMETEEATRDKASRNSSAETWVDGL